MDARLGGVRRSISLVLLVSCFWNLPSSVVYCISVIALLLLVAMFFSPPFSFSKLSCSWAEFPLETASLTPRGRGKVYVRSTFRRHHLWDFTRFIVVVALGIEPRHHKPGQIAVQVGGGTDFRYQRGEWWSGSARICLRWNFSRLEPVTSWCEFRRVKQHEL